MNILRKHGIVYFLLILVVVTGMVWFVIFTLDAHHDLRMTVFDIGQGDSILTSVTQHTKSSPSEYR